VGLEDGHGGEYTIPLRGAEVTRSPMNEERLLRVAAWWNVALHAVALAFAAAVLRRGTPAVPLPERLPYVAAHSWEWTAGWLAWMTCAAALAAFMALLARARPSALTRAAALLALCGAMADVACDAAYMAVLPVRATGDVTRFLAFERHLGLASLTLANGLYTLAVALATLALPPAARAARSLGALTVAGGLVLAAAGVIAGPILPALGTAITIPAFLGWTLAVSSWRGRR